VSDSVAEIEFLTKQDGGSAWVAQLWDRFNHQRRDWIEEKKELRDYIFATDTSTTSNSSLPWKNSTTIPKLCQIRDNLHSNYLSSLFPNDDWLKWEGYSSEDSVRDKRRYIQAYMSNKVRESKFRTEMSKLLYDYIDYGNAFATSSFESRYKEFESGEIIPDYVGPVAHRISPLDVVFNPRATSFENSFKIVRSVKTLGELKKLASINPEQVYWEQVLQRREDIRNLAGGYSIEDFDKALGYSADGFGSMYEYYMSDYMEILEFFGDFHDAATGEIQTNRLVTVVDRSVVVRNVEIPSWNGGAPIKDVRWRFRPDHLWSMWRLDNLVGLQYRLDHLENLKADAMDLTVHPPLKVIGEVEEFVWGPGAEITIDENGDVQELGKNLNGVITAANEMSAIEDRMELYAGAPREAMGLRTPGEKTALEVQTLSNAAGRIFQEKVTNFEINLLEPLLNDMLEVSRRNLDSSDIVRISDNDLGVEEFLTVTKDDITANGKIRPIGARHFAKQAQDLQNLIGVFNSPIAQIIAPDVSKKELTRFINDTINLNGYEIFQPNVAIFEQQETQRLANQAQEDLEVETAMAAELPATVPEDIEAQ
jgi:hypothetical protein